jgi:hypothetical protein
MLLGRYALLVRDFLMRQQCPDYAGIFTRERHSCPMVSTPLHQCVRPSAAPVWCAADPAQGGAGSMDQERPQIDIAAFANAVFIMHFFPQSFRALVQQCFPELGASASVSSQGQRV